MTFWLVRHGSNGEREDIALSQGRMFLGWEELGDITHIRTKEELAKLLGETYPEKSAVTRGLWLGMLWAFLFDMSPGDLVAMPRKALSAIRLGTVAGGAEWLATNPAGSRLTRKVDWHAIDLPRIAFPQELRNSFGALGTVQRIHAENGAARALEVESLVGAAIEKPSENGDEVPILTAARSAMEATEAPPDLAQLARDEIAARLIQRFHGHGLARLVAAVLQAKGYVTFVSPPGKDGGVDVLAGRGPLGFDSPRMAVQVKSGLGKEGAPAIRQLRGAMQNFRAEHGLFVSWGGFTPDAEKEARQHQFDLRLWAQDELIAAMLSVYEELPVAVRAELPLKRIWTLDRTEEE